jgi:hypothetical protein
MEKIIAFYSKSGNCRALANVLSARFGCGTLELTEAKKRKDGFFGFMNCGREAFFNTRSKLIFDIKEKLSPYDRIVLVSPVWAGKTVPAINTALHEADLTGREVTLFACQADPDLTALKKIKTRFKKLLAQKGAIYAKCYCVQGARPGEEPFSYERFDGFLSVLLKDRTI